MASWFVSNCDDTPSNRSALAKRLQDCGVDVDIFGHCGNYNCKEINCWDESLKAKFYLAFENSLCTDYVTEKSYKMTYHNMIPVVYSGGSILK
jgi:alpha-1,3-fucosyltransferase